MCALWSDALPGGAEAAWCGLGRPFFGVGSGRVDEPCVGGPLMAIEGADTAMDGTGTSGVAIVGRGRLLFGASVGSGRLSFVRA